MPPRGYSAPKDGLEDVNPRPYVPPPICEPCEPDLEDEYMGLALGQADLALRASEVPVGCVFVHASRGVVGRGHNNTVASCNGTRHAEIEAIDAIMAAEKASGPDVLRACTVYVTVEPCIMCASALRQIGVRGVVYGCGNDKFGGCGSVMSIHDDPGNDVPGAEFGPPPMPARGGVREGEAIAMLRLFYSQENKEAPVPQRRTKKQLELADRAAETVASWREREGAGAEAEGGASAAAAGSSGGGSGGGGGSRGGGSSGGSSSGGAAAESDGAARKQPRLGPVPEAAAAAAGPGEGGESAGKTGAASQPARDNFVLRWFLEQEAAGRTRPPGPL
jgi:tRNA-specific adenosine deaminase 2